MINKKDTQRITTTFKIIFGVDDSQIQYADQNEQGSCFGVSTQVRAVSDWQFEQLKKLTDNIPHPFIIHHRLQGINLFFFSTDLEGAKDW